MLGCVLSWSKWGKQRVLVLLSKRKSASAFSSSVLALTGKLGNCWCTEGLWICCKANTFLMTRCVDLNVNEEPYVHPESTVTCDISSGALVQPTSVPSVFVNEIFNMNKSKTNGASLQAFRCKFNNKSLVNYKPLCFFFVFVCLQERTCFW